VTFFLPVILVILVISVVVAVVFLRSFDLIAGRGPKQIEDGINASSIAHDNRERVACPHCAEMIVPAAKLCPHCKTPLV